jgi:hypothetical protein
MTDDSLTALLLLIFCSTKKHLTMKKLSFISSVLLALVLTCSVFQIKAQETVSEELRVKEWIDGQTITVFNHPITRVFGETYDKNSIRNYHIPVTNIGYKDLGQLMDETRAIAKSEKWPEEDIDDVLQNLETNAPGGRLYVYIERAENDRVRANYFFVVFRDSNDEEFYRSDVDRNQPEFGDFGFWSNYFEMDIPVEVEVPFFVYVNDRKSPYLSNFKFEVLE